MKKSKALILTLCVIGLVAISLAGTLAYLASEDEVINTFTVGNVKLTLDEAKVDANGEAIGTERVKANTYHLIPGQTYWKDPTVTVKSGSEDSYVRMILTINNASAVQTIIDLPKNGLTDYADLFSGWDPATWVYTGYEAEDFNATENTITFEFRYKETVSGHNAADEKSDMVLPPLFTQLVVPGSLTGDELNALYNSQNATDNFKITVKAHAIQAAGFQTAEEAWSAFETQITP